MRSVLVPGLCVAAVLSLVGATNACGGSTESTFDDPAGTQNDGGCIGLACGQDGPLPHECVGLECKQTTCEGKELTTVTGTVYDPAGKVPIYNAAVYVPNAPLDDIPAGAKACDRCDASVSGKPLVITATDTSGHFRLENVPVGTNIPLVIQIGKWRRKVEIPNIAKCANTALDAKMTRLPRTRAEGNIPRIALTTGGADPLQCLLRKIGLDDSEFGTAESEARIHLYAGGGFVQGTPKAASSKFAPTINGGSDFAAAETFWSDKTKLKQYDIVLLACEGDENESTTGSSKPDPAKQALYDYAKEGGRVFASHYHEIWFRKSPESAVKAVATWADPERPPPAAGNPATTAVEADISASFPKAVAMKDWLSKQNALAGGKLPIFDARHNVDAVGSSALNWISALNPNASNMSAVQYMTFNTPVGASADDVCGRVVFSNLHVGAGEQAGKTDDPQAPFPDGCNTVDLSAQQKALEFMLFDLSSCVQKDDSAIVPPR